MNEAKLPDAEGAREYFRNKLRYTTGPVELSRMINEQPVRIIDVRASEDYQAGHIPGAVNLPQSRWAETEALDRRSPNVVYCYHQQCHLAAKAALEFAGRGFPVIELEGGFEAWRENELPVEDHSQSGRPAHVQPEATI